MRLIILFCLFFNTSSQLDAFESQVKNIYLTPNDIEKSKHMRKEFLNPINLPGYKYVKENKNMTSEEKRERSISQLKADIKSYEKFPDINDWEETQILFLKSRLAFLERRYEDANELLTTIIESGNATDKTISQHYYKLYQLMFKAKKYDTSEQLLSIAVSKGHSYFPWDAANMSEIAFRKYDFEKGKKLLIASIDALKTSHCPVEDKWLNILQKISDAPSGDAIRSLQSSSEPWFYSISLDESLPLPRETRMQPSYPRKAQLSRMNGHITLSFIVNDKGSVVCSFLVEGAGKEFLNPSKKAVRKFKYHPAILNGKPSWIYGVKTRFTFQMN